MLDDPTAAAEMLGRDPYPRELAYAEVAARTEHLVLSTTLADVTWPSARIVRSIEEIRTFKHDGHGTVYVVGGPTLITSLLDAGLLERAQADRPPDPRGSGSGHHRSARRRPTAGARRGRTGRRRTRDAHLPGARGRDERLAVRSERLQRVRDQRVPRERRHRGRRARGHVVSSCSQRSTRGAVNRARRRSHTTTRHRYLVIASNGGAARNPAWFRNLERGRGRDGRGRPRSLRRDGNDPQRPRSVTPPSPRSSPRRRQRPHSKRRPAE